MFPIAKQETHLKLSSSPQPFSRETMKSTYLPYFKRFPNHKFHSQQRKRPNQSNELQPKRFFTEEKQAEESVAERHSPFAKVFSSPGIKQREEKIHTKIRPRLIKQIYERESVRKKRASEHYLIDRPVQRSLSLQKRLQDQQVLAPLDVVKHYRRFLTDLEIGEITAYNKVYYFGQKCSKKQERDYEKQSKDGEAGQGYPWSVGDHIAYRYQFIELLGQGSFGQVFKCIDHKCNKQSVALKIVKNNEKYAVQAKTEIKILNFIREKDPCDTKNCIEIKESFNFRNQICMVFNLMSINLYELIKSNGYYGLPLDLIRRFVLQILNSIHFLHKNKLIHADLKPENILLKEQNKSGVKIIDFGSSCFENQTIYTYIQSRYYRAPEVILGLPYDRKIDIWSFGCIIAELHLGYPLFAGEDEHEQMCLIVEVLGMPPKELMANSKRWHIFFDSRNSLKPHEKKTAPMSKSLKKALEDASQGFVEFIRTCLEWNPEKRVEALTLLKHEWVLEELPQDFKAQHLKFIREEEDGRKKSTLRIREKFKSK